MSRSYDYVLPVVRHSDGWKPICRARPKSGPSPWSLRWRPPARHALGWSRCLSVRVLVHGARTPRRWRRGRWSERGEQSWAVLRRPWRSRRPSYRGLPGGAMRGRGDRHSRSATVEWVAGRWRDCRPRACALLCPFFRVRRSLL